MLVAYLRGYLKPDYAHGLRSIIRENFILQAISRELDANEVITRIQTEAGYASLMAPAQANTLLKHHDKMLSLAYGKLKHESAKDNLSSKVDLKSIDKFIEVYRKLAAQGIVGEKQDA